jgi:transposase-like protein
MEKRRKFTPEQKAKMVLEMLREERTVGEIAAEYEIHPTQLHKWKAEALDHLPSLFTRGASETEKMRKQHEKEKDQLTQQIGQLSVELNWLKKKSDELDQRRRAKRDDGPSRR